jgi:hypothetical protein
MANHTDIHDERYGEAGRRNQQNTTEWVRGRGTTRPLLTPVDADDAEAVHADDAISIDEVVERLSRDMAAAVRRAAEGKRDELHEYEVQMHHEQHEAASTHPRSPAKRARITLFSIALWLAVAGVLLTFVLPAAGIVCLVMAGLAGIVAAVLGPGDDRPERFTQ